MTVRVPLALDPIHIQLVDPEPESSKNQLKSGENNEFLGCVATQI